MAVFRVTMCPKADPLGGALKFVVVIAEGKGVARKKAQARYKDFVPIDVVRMGTHSVEGRKSI